MTVNTMMGAVMAFVRFCHVHEWIDRVPPLSKLDVDDVMKGRPITPEELDAMLNAVPEVVGKRSSASRNISRSSQSSASVFFKILLVQISACSLHKGDGKIAVCHYSNC